MFILTVIRSVLGKSSGIEYEGKLLYLYPLTLTLILFPVLFADLENKCLTVIMRHSLFVLEYQEIRSQVFVI